MQNLIISSKISEKLIHKHGIRRIEVEECFLNRIGKSLRDTREEHRSDPPTVWFIGETHQGRLLKIVYVKKGNKYYLRTAYEPNQEEKNIYNSIAF